MSSLPTDLDEKLTDDDDEGCPDCEGTGITWEDAFSHVSGHYTKDVPCGCLAGERMESDWEAAQDARYDQWRDDR